MLKVLLINGPNINLLGSREPEFYGNQNLKEAINKVNEVASKNGIRIENYQSNHEGNIIDFIHSHQDARYTIINPGGLGHTSVSLRDALLAAKIPFIEVHISNTYKRENFRHHSYLSDKADGIIIGCGVEGYILAMQLVINKTKVK